MRRFLFGILFTALAGICYADGPQDNQFDKVRPVPPPGVKIEDEARKELESGVSALQTEVDKLAQSTDALVKLNLPDVQIYLNAVKYALKYDEFLINAPNISPTTKSGEKKTKDQIEAERKAALERAAKGQVDLARKALKNGLQRAKELQDKKPSWSTAKGLVPRGYQSKIDESVQPYVLVVPESYDPKKPTRLDFWCHGRGETLSELNFLQTGKGQFTPPNAIVCHLYGRFCCANKLAGEIDLLEALADISKKYNIDSNRLVVRGFSMGGASTWHFAVHYPSLFCAAAPGAGFSETPEFLKVFQNEKITPTDYEQKLWHMYNATDTALNLFNIPTIAYSGEIDSQKQAADMMVKALDKEGMQIPHIIGPKTGHSYHKDAIPLINKFVDEAAEKGKPDMPETVKFATFTLRYNKSYWVQIDELEQHWEQARVIANLKAMGTQCTIETKNVAALTLVDLKAEGTTLHVLIDGTPFQIERVAGNKADSFHFRKDKGAWKVVNSPEHSGLHKVHGLQGPIDDAFLDRFILVKPTGKSANADVEKWVNEEMNRAIMQWRKVFRGEPLVKDDKDITEADIKSSNLILWGDPQSNSVYAKIADKLPIQPKADAPKIVPLLIYPNPLNPKKYIVTNSGFTFREYDALNNARQVPKLPDWALVDISTPPNGRYPGKVVEAGFFDESWKKK
ncbi:prolyl oligopeptidase family serine peptidase [Telmatocola sphagniphila]|uniref:Prolyl oligopeptidase family serine peptidase n=1 Tax=Telmatocola sphagniphila TaxID=1123043 RepID=A0A8E6ETW3_9BACT|nr:prolyl oligopeptidase family serine peptidase [Telmatocola sphagniphila]QVL30625.1 prolyl oligopeptidase family serine peptidase [Telmatocola sphagniphila]